MTGTYLSTTEGCTYEVFTVETGKGRVKKPELRMRCIKSLTKSPDNVFPVSEDQIAYYIKIGSFQKIA